MKQTETDLVREGVRPQESYGDVGCDHRGCRCRRGAADDEQEGRIIVGTTGRRDHSGIRPLVLLNEATSVATVGRLTVISLGQSPGSLASPVVGYLFDINSRAFRPVSGIVGSSTIGEPIDFGFQMSWGVSLPDSAHVIAVPDSGTDLVSIDLSVRPPRSSLSSVRRKPFLKSISVHAERPQCWSIHRLREFKSLRDFQNNPAIALDINSESMPGGVILHAAVNDDASALLMAIAEEGIETIYRWNRTEGFRALAPVVHSGAWNSSAYLMRYTRTRAGMKCFLPTM